MLMVLQLLLLNITQYASICPNKDGSEWHCVKVEPGPHDIRPGSQDPFENSKNGPRTP